MGKHIECGDLVQGCQFTAEAGTEAHAAKEHGVTEVTPELAAKVKAAIRTR
jgi:predicted small metal-binding protein